MTIKEFSPNEYRVVGKFTMSKRKTKSVVVDGEEYFKEWTEEEIVDAEKLDTYKIELDELASLGFSACVWEYPFLYNKLFKTECQLESRYRLSDNDYVAYWQWLHNTGRTPNWIKNVYSDRTGWRFRERISKTCKLKICDYGFNNSLYADVDWDYIFNFENKDPKNEHFIWINDYLSRYGINIFATEEKQKAKNAIRLLIK